MIKTPIMGQRMSTRGYARARNVDEKAIRKQIVAGAIVRGNDGLIDADQADKAWYRLHLSRRGQASAKRQSGVVLADARLQWARAKLATEASRFADLEDSFHERATVERTLGDDATDFLVQLGDVPQKYSTWFGDEIGPRLGRRILDRLISAIVGELGDLHGQMLALCRRVR
jgi:hypothetical protein